MAKGKLRWDDLPDEEKIVKILKHRGVSAEIVEHFEKRCKEKKLIAKGGISK